MSKYKFTMIINTWIHRVDTEFRREAPEPQR